MQDIYTQKSKECSLEHGVSKDDIALSKMEKQNFLDMDIADLATRQ